ncbi:MAG: PucR family transcriptional regulator ligand-binding domain-containing protein [Clostridiales bacterium]|nr:MAG: PucR family transcriptional regulator ligand-binding domain-containing protein [Clostridiales bacterium]
MTPKQKYSLKLLAGKGGLDNAVRWVHMVEDRQVPDFLHGGELVFTTGIGHVGKDPLFGICQTLKSSRRVGRCGEYRSVSYANPRRGF